MTGLLDPHTPRETDRVGGEMLLEDEYLLVARDEWRARRREADRYWLARLVPRRSLARRARLADALRAIAAVLDCPADRRGSRGSTPAEIGGKCS